MGTKSAYNFAPLNSKIYLPSWGPFVSHDIPFAHGADGEISLTINAKSPIFVRRGDYDRDDPRTFSFSNHNGRYFIPGSSIKGMFRSVMEILTLGRLAQYNDKGYSYREFVSGSDYHNNFVYNFGNHTKIGWLKKIDGIPTIYFSREVSDSKVEYRNVQYDKGTLEDFRGKGKKLSFDFYNLFREGYPFELADDKPNLLKNEEGWYLMTGQTGMTGDSAKKKQYIIGEQRFDKYGVRISDEVWKTFLLVVADGAKDENEEWTKWKGFLDDGKAIPVFYNDENKVIKHLGITRTFKLPYVNRIKAIVENSQEPASGPLSHLDMASLIFGYVTKDENTSLKGRVHISHAFAQGETRSLSSADKALASPKSSFVNYYLKQKVKKNGTLNGKKNTYNSKAAVISGRKRYPIHSNDRTADLGNSDNKDVMTTFIPLDKGARFKTKIRFYNLLPEEIGALISAITFHNHSSCLHSIGMGKPLGYGQIAVNIDSNESTINGSKLDDSKQAEYLQFFQSDIERKVGEDTFRKDEGIRELINMAIPQALGDGNSLEYPQFSTKGLNEFVNIGKSKGLPVYSKLVQNDLDVKMNRALNTQSTFEMNERLFLKLENLISDKIKLLDTKLRSYDSLVRQKAAKVEISTPKKSVEELSALGEAAWKDMNAAKKIDSLKNATNKWLVATGEKGVPQESYPEFLKILRILWDDNKENNRKRSDWFKKNNERWLIQKLDAKIVSEFYTENDVVKK